MSKEQSTPQRQASIKAVFGFRTVTAAAHHYRMRWDREHPGNPLHLEALFHGLLADMNASLPEPFTIETPAAAYITGPELAHLPIGWAVARSAFRAMDLRLDTYTTANVEIWRDQGHGGYPWPPPQEPDETPPSFLPAYPGATITIERP